MVEGYRRKRHLPSLAVLKTQFDRKFPAKTRKQEYRLFQRLFIRGKICIFK